MSDDDKLDPQIDLMDRYQTIVDSQTNVLKNFDNKAWRALRTTSLIIGAGLTALSLLLSSQLGLEPDFSRLPLIISLTIGIVSLVVSIGFGILSYLSIVFAFGPNKQIGSKIAGQAPETDEYKKTVLKSYVEAIRQNGLVLSAKARRFRYTLSLMLVGVLNFALSILLLVWKPYIDIAWGVFGTVICLSGGALYYILNKEYTVLDNDNGSPGE